VSGTSKYVEKRAKIIYDIMVKRGIVIPEYDDIMRSPEYDQNQGLSDKKDTTHY
jgi:hypothetical protein